MSIIGIAVHKQASKQTNKQPYRHHSEKISRSARAGATNKYHSRLNFCGESKSGLEIKEFPVEMPFPAVGGGVPLFGLHIHTHTRMTD